MNAKDSLRFIIVICYCVSICLSKRGFILSAPKVLDVGTTEYFTLALFDVPDRVPVNIRLLAHQSDDVIAETTEQSKSGQNRWVRMAIPDVKDNWARIHVRGSFNVPGGYEIDEKALVKLRRVSVVTFIQTDKPLYKPSQSVKFRILPLDNELTPLSGPTVGNVWIEDPSSIRVAQWSQVDLTKGIAQLELPLSNEPPFGVWKIHAEVRNFTHTQTFRVEEYVLPKFEVSIEPPKYLLSYGREFLLKVCALYTYGKDVEGLLYVNVDHSAHSAQRFQREISGCAELIVPQDTGNHTNSIQVFATVLENVTGVVQNASVAIPVFNSPVKLNFLKSGNGTQYFKPGLPYHGKLQVSKPDNQPIPSKKVTICAILSAGKGKSLPELCNKFTSSREGLINFILPPQNESVVHVELKATALNHDKGGSRDVDDRVPISSEARQDLFQWYSPTQSHIQIESIPQEVSCERMQRVKVFYTNTQQSDIRFYHQVLARGRIIQLGSHFRSFSSDSAGRKVSRFPDHILLKEKELPRPIYGPVLPQIPDNNKDSASIPYSEFKISFDTRKVMSHIARVLVYYIRDDGEIVADTASFQVEKCLQNKVKLLFRHSVQYPDTDAPILLTASPQSLCGISMVDKSVHLLAGQNKFDKEEVFNRLQTFDIGMRTKPTRRNTKICEYEPEISFPDDENYFDDLRRRRRSFRKPSLFFAHHKGNTITAHEEAGTVVLTDFLIYTLPCERRPLVLHSPSRVVVSSHGGRKRAKMGKRLPWTPGLDGDQSIPGASDTLEIRNYFPETWLWELQEVGTSGEIALNKKLPHTITEWMGSAVCIHPKYGLGISDVAKIVSYQPFFTSLTLPYSIVRGEAVPITISVFNYLSECLPIKLSLEPSDALRIVNDTSNAKLCVCGGKSGSRVFQIQALTIGSVNITAYAYTMQKSNVCGNEVISRRGGRDAVTRSLIVEAEGFSKEEVFNSFFCPLHVNGSYAEEFDLLLPDDVVEGSARCVISVTGDLMGPALNGLEELVRLPVGCGEQNMVLFTPNIYILDYLTNIGRSDKAIKQKAKDFMMKGYQRELKYRRMDGSYSAFGQSDKEGSMWLTAFVVRSFASARRFITIDEQDLLYSIHWILRRQLENGCFPLTGYILNADLQGGLDEGSKSLAPLTAYVMLSLLESGFNVQRVIENAFLCLRSSQATDDYSLGLYAYTAALAKSPLAEEYIAELEDRAVVEGNLMYWNHANKATAVEIAGYAILAMMEIDDHENVHKIVRWVALQRNSNGGFYSTQDTVVALQALAKYGRLVARDPINIGVAVEADDFVRGFKVDETNKILTQTSTLPILPTVVEFQAAGEGCALVQVSLKYNVHSHKKSKVFDLNIKGSREGSLSCNAPSIGICMRYKVPGAESNMAVAEVKMMTGFVPDVWSLHTQQNDVELGLKRFEVVGNVVNLYFMKLTNVQKCFRFLLKTEMEVTHPKEGTVKLYDYYYPEQEVTKNYFIPSSCLSPVFPDLPFLTTETPVTTTEPTETTSKFSITNTAEETTTTTNPSTTNFPETDSSPTETTAVEMTTNQVIMSETTEFYSTTTGSSATESAEFSSVATESLESSSMAAEKFFESSSNGLTPTESTEALENSSSTLEFSSTVDMNTLDTSLASSTAADLPETTELYILSSSETSSSITAEYTSTAGSDITSTAWITSTAVKSESTTEFDEFSSMPAVSAGLESQLTTELELLNSAQTLVPTVAEIMLADESVHNLPSGLQNFIESNDELDFPDGIESNLPIFVPTPKDFEINHSAFSFSGNSMADCPVCLSEFPENFTNIYCHSMALRVSVRNAKDGVVKILHDISAHYQRPKPVNELGTMSYNRSCDCPQITKGAVLLLFGHPNYLWSNDGTENIVHLTGDAYLILSSSRSARPPQLKTARRNCIS